MSSLNTRGRRWIVADRDYTLQYDLIGSINPSFEDFELWEFGIQCKLFDEQHTLLSEAEVTHITPKAEQIASLLNTIIKHKVYPVHLLDVVSDELMRNLDCDYSM